LNRSRDSVTSRGSDLIVQIETGGFYSRIYGNNIATSTRILEQTYGRTYATVHHYFPHLAYWWAVGENKSILNITDKFCMELRPQVYSADVSDGFSARNNNRFCCLWDALTVLIYIYIYVYIYI